MKRRRLLSSRHAVRDGIAARVRPRSFGFVLPQLCPIDREQEPSTARADAHILRWWVSPYWQRRRESARGEPGKSVCKTRLRMVFSERGDPHPHAQPGPRRVFCIRWNSRVHGLARELIPRATASQRAAHGQWDALSDCAS